MKQVKRSCIRWSAVLVVLALAATSVQAAVLYDSGYVTFAPTGTQFGRIFRDGVPSDWSGPKPFPGVTGAPTARAYELITVNTGPFAFIQIDFDDPSVRLFDAAYITAYTPVNSAPNYGLDVNYLGDPGLSEPFGFPSFFQIVVAPNTDLLIAINELSPGGGTGRTFSLIVEGFYDTEYNDIPEPSSILLVGGGAALLGALRWKNRSVGQRNFNASES